MPSEAEHVEQIVKLPPQDSGPDDKDLQFFHSTGDCVLRVEGVHFKVHKLYLSRDAASVFCTMFEDAKEAPASDGVATYDGFEVIELEDTLEEFRALCWAIYALPDEIQKQNLPGTDIPITEMGRKLSRGMSEAKVEKIKDAANKIMGSSCATGVEVQDKRKGSKAVDQIMGGASNSISRCDGATLPLPASVTRTTVCGEFRTGKPQLAHYERHCVAPAGYWRRVGQGASGKVAYMDTNFDRGNVLPRQSQGYRRAVGVEPNMALENILYARAFIDNSDIKSMELLNECSQRFVENKDFRLLIVDSIIALFRTDFSARGEVSCPFHPRRLSDALYSRMLSKLSEEYNVSQSCSPTKYKSDSGATMA
ncbi:RecA family ATPase [Mycena kentingensis (nom. inval.)]|nr:RecA family ATPase [Mycena kentingensis (nom. inval.)]